MGITSGPKLVSDSLVFAIDAGNAKGISGVGNANFTNAKQFIKNLMNMTASISPDSTLKLTNTDYYTVVAIDYPESTNGGTYVGRNGVTPGFKVTTGAKTYDSSRALHLWVWNNDSKSWIDNSYFTGYRVSGHCYDTYSGSDAPGGYAGELAKFASDFNKIKTAFPNCTYIVMGSHRDSYRDSTVRAILYDLGMSTGTTLDTDYVAAPEWILVGKPGLGANNAYAWVYENNDSTSAVAVVGLNNLGNGNNSFLFDGSTNYINASTVSDSFLNSGSWTISFWAKFTSINKGTDNSLAGHGTTGTNTALHLAERGGYAYFGLYANDLAGTIAIQAGTWVNMTFTYNYATKLKTIYINGVYDNSGGTVGYSGTGSNFEIGRYGYAPSSAKMYGSIATVHIYGRVLTAAEVQQNFAALRGRFGI